MTWQTLRGKKGSQPPREDDMRLYLASDHSDSEDDAMGCVPGELEKAKPKGDSLREQKARGK